MGDTLAQNACNMDAMSKYHEGALRRALNFSVLALSKIRSGMGQVEPVFHLASYHYFKQILGIVANSVLAGIAHLY